MFTKSSEQKKSIGAVAKEIEIQEYTIRFWETQFPKYITPAIGLGGRRYYYEKDIKILKTIKDYLYNKNYSIKNLQNLLDSGVLNLLSIQEESNNNNNIKSNINFVEENKKNLEKVQNLNYSFSTAKYDNIQIKPVEKNTFENEIIVKKEEPKIETKIVKEFVYLENQVSNEVREQLFNFQKKLMEFNIKLENV